jgi:hypothetical protein
MPKKASGSHAKHAAQAEEDDEATKQTGPPKLAKETKKILEESKRMNAAGGPVQPKKKLHPLVPIGVAFLILAVLLLVMNWMTTPAASPDGEPAADPRGAVQRLFDW